MPEVPMSDAPAAAATPTDPAAAPAPTPPAAPAAPTDPAPAPAPADPTAPPAGSEPPKPPEPPTGAPEKYELAAPEGFQLEPETTAQFETVARELNLSNEQANKLIPLGAQLAQKLAAQQQEGHAKQVAQWLEDSKADKEIGGDKFDASVQVALKARDKFATPELKTLMDQTGIGNHPEIVRLFHRIGTAIADDTFVQAPSGGGSQKSAASVLFDHPSSQTQR
jgi:hypothetical protein